MRQQRRESMGGMSTPAERMAAAKVRSSHPLTLKFSQGFDFPLDDFQIESLHCVEDGNGLLVAAPTGAGKTVVGEFAAFLALEHGKKCFYTTPIKALSNQKFAEFVAKFGEENVGLLTGDTNINSEAPILVMTTEVLRNMIRGGGAWEKVAGLSRIQLWRQVCFKTFMVIPAKSIFCKTVWTLSR